MVETTSREHLEKALPGGIVAQRYPNDCFPACISMLTGIDPDLLPLLPPAASYYENHGGWIHVNPEGDRWQEWHNLLLDNGYAFESCSPAWEGFYVSCLFNLHLEIAHSVVSSHDGIIIDPAGGIIATAEDYAKDGWVGFKNVVVRPL